VLGRSFDQVYSEFADFVLRDARSRGVPRAAIDDVVQEVFVAVHERMSAFDNPTAMRGWLSTLVDEVARAHVQPAPPAALAAPDRTAASAPDEAVDHKTVATLLDELLRRMSDVQREVFLMHELEDMSVGEITTALPANRNTVYARLRAARRIFRGGIRPLRET
jgi:RNA polymerase sigma-70 factor (ECF subfamily)